MLLEEPQHSLCCFLACCNSSAPAVARFILESVYSTGILEDSVSIAAELIGSHHCHHCILLNLKTHLETSQLDGNNLSVMTAADT